jgi:hypothetical protein
MVFGVHCESKLAVPALESQEDWAGRHFGRQGIGLNWPWMLEGGNMGIFESEEQAHGGD